MCLASHGCAGAACQCCPFHPTVGLEQCVFSRVAMYVPFFYCVLHGRASDVKGFCFILPYVEELVV